MDLHICIGKCFATWLRIQILMAFLLAWIIILIGTSGYLMLSDGGNLSNLSIPVNGTSVSLGYSDWTNNVCKKSPYMYLRPFGFSYTDSHGHSSSSSTYCAYPDINSNFRMSVCVLSFVTIFILYFKTPLSYVARPIWITYALLYFAIFVLDADASLTGYYTCTSNFANTKLQTDINRAGLTITCDTNKYPGLVVVDMIVTLHFSLLYTAWALATDLYVKAHEPPRNETQNTMLGMKGNPVSTDAESPMHRTPKSKA